MRNNHDYLQPADDPTFRLRGDMLMLMMKGAGYGALFCVAVGVFFAVTLWIGSLLPEESKQADDPTPFSYVLPVDSRPIA